MKKMARLLRCCGVMACGMGASLAWLAAGCGGETLPAVDVAVLNAELAQVESGLSDRLAALEPEAVDEACRYAKDRTGRRGAEGGMTGNTRPMRTAGGDT